jgi:hypothetical protein
MPLQIRRGTEAQRTSQSINLILAEGELLWVTDQQKLYIGQRNLITDQLVPASLLSPVTGFTNEDAQDAVGALLQAGPHQGITFTYNDMAGTLSAAVDLSNYSGVITGDIIGSVFAESSAMLVDGTNGRIILDGTVKGHIVPDANEQYDLGSSSFRFRDLYLSGSSIELGDATITSVGSAVDLPAGSTVGGAPIDVRRDNSINVSIVGDDSSIIVNASNNEVTGTFIGDITGSVFSDNSTLIIDGTNSTINSNTIVHTDGIVSIGSVALPSSLNVISDQEEISAFYGVTDGTDPPFVGIGSVRGNFAEPTTLIAGDDVVGWRLTAYDGEIFKTVVAINASTTSAADFNENNPQSDFKLYVANNTSLSEYIFKGDGTFIAPGAVQLAVYTDDAARLAAIPTPAQGMMVFMQSGTVPTVTNKTVVYDGTAWVALH